jgi:Ca-activated chloride channel family protein
MINYFDQNYESPRRSEAFALHADGAPSPFPNEEEIYVRFGVQGYEIPAEERPPLALTFVIDVSGSMDYENRLELVKWSLDYLVDQLREDDTVAIVAYTDYAFVVLEPTSGADWRTIKGSLANLYPMDSTNLEEGLDLGYTLANKAYRRDAVNRVILCSDGVANVGNTTAEAILDTVGEWARMDIHLTSIGFGMGNFNDVLMEQLADKGDGFYAYVDDQDEARRLFVDELTGSLITIGMNAKIQVAFNPEVVEGYRLIGFENREVADEDFRNDDVDAGEIGAGHSVTALYAVVLNRGANGEIATLQFRWEDPETGRVFEIAQRITTSDLYRNFSSADPHFQLTTLVGRWGEILNESPYATNTSLYEFTEYVWGLSRIFGEDADVNEFLDLVETSARLKR